MGLFLFSFWFALSAQAADLNAFGQSEAWKAILHYQKNIIGSEASEVSGRNFFFAEDGAKNPGAELKATLVALSKSLTPGQDENEHAVCKFPARLKLLLDAGLIAKDAYPHLNCPSFQVYKTRIQTQKVSIVFSSYYLGSASSIFGHSFLRFSGNNDNELFDTGINFSATPTTQNPILYALFGLIGVFPATFSAQPFYYKVREYNDFESRDLWTYELKLNPEERAFLLDHLWELGNTSFRYFYFNENCSYHILRAVEAAVPRIKFFNRRPVYLIPSESIQVLYHPKSKTEIVGSVNYRPSLRNVAYWRYAKLTKHDQTLVLHALKTKSGIPNAQADHLVETLDTLIDAIDLNFSSEILGNIPEIVAWKQSVLQARSERLEISKTPDLPIPHAENPAVGHGSRRIDLAYGFDRVGVSSPYLDFRVRASHHDLLDPSIGFPPNLQIDFGRVGFRYFTQTQKFVMQELTIVDLNALAVVHPLFSKISYDALITYDRTPNADCADQASCGALRVKGGIGKTYSPFEREVLFFLLNFEPKYGFHYFGSHFKFGVEPSLNSLFEFSPRVKLLLSGRVEHTLLSEHAFSSNENAELRWGFDNHFGMGLKADWFQQSEFQERNLVLKGFYYF